MSAQRDGVRRLFDVSVEDLGTTRTITPRGEIDIASAESVAEPLLNGLRDGLETVVLDLSSTTFIDSTGVRVVLHATRRAAQLGVRFIVLPAPDEVHRVFELCGLTDLIPFAAKTPSVAEAS